MPPPPFPPPPKPEFPPDEDDPDWSVKEDDLLESNSGVPLGHDSHALDATQRSADPVSRMTLNDWALEIHALEVCKLCEIVAGEGLTACQWIQSHNSLCRRPSYRRQWHVPQRRARDGRLTWFTILSPAVFPDRFRFEFTVLKSYFARTLSAAIAQWSAVRLPNRRRAIGMWTVASPCGLGAARAKSGRRPSTKREEDWQRITVVVGVREGEEEQRWPRRSPVVFQVLLGHVRSRRSSLASFYCRRGTRNLAGKAPPIAWLFSQPDSPASAPPSPPLHSSLVSDEAPSSKYRNCCASRRIAKEH
jgi:hypothetical protein